MTTGFSLSGRGGSAFVQIACSGCGQQHQFSSSSFSASENRRNIVSYALRLAAFASGIGFSGYHKLFGRYLGMEATSGKMFHRVIEEAYPHITDMLDEICELAKQDMKEMSCSELGSWKRAVTTSDDAGIFEDFFPKCYICHTQLAFGRLAMVWACLYEGIRCNHNR